MVLAQVDGVIASKSKTSQQMQVQMQDNSFSSQLLSDAAIENLKALLYEDEIDMSVVISDPNLPDSPLVFVSENFTTQTGYAREEAIGRNCRFLQGADTHPSAVEAIRNALEARTRITIDLLNYRKDGTAFMNRLRIRPIFDASGALAYYVGAQNPIE